MNNINKTICKCDCHKKGTNMLHITSCCDFTYEKYINDDGSVDMEIYNSLVERINNTQEENEVIITSLNNSYMGRGKTFTNYFDRIKEKEEHIKYLNDNCNTRQVRRKKEREAKKLNK